MLLHGVVPMGQNKSNDAPIISIVMPVYNTEAYLEECLESISRQTYRHFEVLCVNDGSTDNSPAILEAHARKDPRFRVIHQANQGAGGARNTALDQARGKFLYFVDSDDLIHPNGLERLLYLIAKTRSDVACAKYLPIKKAPPRRTEAKKASIEVTKDPLSLFASHPAGTPAAVWNKLFRRSAFGDWRFTPDVYYEDFPLMVCLFSELKSCVLTDEPLYYYRQRPNSIMNSELSKKKVHDFIKGVVFICRYFSKNKKNVSTPAILKRCFQVAQKAIRDNKYTKASPWALYARLGCQGGVQLNALMSRSAKVERAKART